MKWKTTAPKKRQQVFLLVGLGGLGLVSVLVQFIVIPAGSALGYQKQEARLRNERIRQAENELRSETRDRAANQEKVRALRALLDTAPPEANPNLWVTEHVYRIARQTGFSMDSLQEVATATPTWLLASRGKAAAALDAEPVEPKGKAPRPSAPDADPKSPQYRFGIYRAQASGTADYETLKLFFEELEKAFPLMAVQNLIILAGAVPDRQDIRFTLEWPRDTGAQAERPPAPAAGEPGGKS